MWARKAVEQIAEMRNRVVGPRNRRARRGRDFPPLIVAPRKRPVSLSHFEGTHVRGSTKYPCDPKSGRKREGGRGRGFIDYA